MKHIQRTSSEAYLEKKKNGDLARQEALVEQWLQLYHERHRQWPTSYELFKAMQVEHEAFDLNSVRPALTRLKEFGRVYNPAIKRACSVTGRRAFTWCPTSAEDRAAAAAATKPVKQERLF